MSRRSLIAAVSGTLAGALFGALALALAAGRVLDAGMAAAPDGGGVFAVTQAGMYLYVVAAGVVAGAILGMIGYAAGHSSGPDERRYGLGIVAALGAGAGAVAGFATTRAAMGLASDIAAGIVVVTPFRAALVALAAGAATGLVVAVAAERLSLPEVYGFEGAAVPRSLGQFVRDAVAAVGLPALGLAVGALLVFGFSRVLLEADTTVALVAFGGVAALVLFGAAVVAARPPRRR